MSISKDRADYLAQYIIDKSFVVMGKQETTTVCCITTYNGFDIIGTSSCVDPEKYNFKLGCKYAYEDALEKFDRYQGYVEVDRYYVNNGNKVPTKH